MSKADSLTQAQINRVLATCLLLPHSEAKRCSVVLSHAALRVTEIALLKTKHILYPSGNIREEVALPAKICKHLKPRVIWLSNPKARSIIQEWIDYRKSKLWAVTKSNEFQGLNPESRFLLNNRGRSYALQPKPRVMLDGEVKTYWACDSLEQSFRKLYSRCGLHTASSHTGRKSLVTNAIIRGESLGGVDLCCTFYSQQYIGSHININASETMLA